jgi:nitroreductase
MNRRDFLWPAAVLAAASGLPGGAQAADNETITLPEPDLSGGMPLMRALSARKSERAFAPDELDEAILSGLLWACLGVNRPNGKRTAPTALNKQEISVFCAMAKGCYRYEAGDHRLVRVTDKDIRKLTAKQEFAWDAPLNLIFVADKGRQESEFYAATDTGFASQNAYLYCASNGLATVVRAWFDRESLARAMGLGENMFISLCQTVGYPA